MNHIATAIFLMCSGTTANDPQHPQIPKSMLSSLELGITAILDLLIITAITLITVYCHTPCHSGTHQARSQQILSSAKITIFALPIVASVFSTAIVAVISLKRQSICEIL